MILASLALAAIEAPEERLDRLHERIVAANPELCRQNACPRPVMGKTSRCGWAEGRTVTIDRACFAKLSDDEAAFLIGHEWAHVATGTKDEAGADWLGWAMMLRAGFDPVRANRIYVTLKVRR